jgi:hypothetical protein
LIDFRWIEVIIEWESIIPLLIFLKKDKNYWENIRWESYEKITEKEYDLAVKDIKNWDFEIF